MYHQVGTFVLVHLSPTPHQANPRQTISFGICDVCVDRLLLLVLLLYFAEFSAERRADRRRI